MTEIFVKNYQENEHLRKSFNQLAANTFGIEFETWYQHGYWTEKYIPYSFVEKGDVIANVSVNLINLVIHNEIKTAVQIGTVMTHSDYRNRGLSRRLMELVLHDYQNVDLIYLFANPSVLEFYPKFGFRAAEEVQFSLDYKHDSAIQTGMRRLDGRNKKDLTFVYKFAANRVCVSSTFGTSNTTELVMFYFMMVFPDHFYYLDDEQVLVIFEIEKNILHLYDLISYKKVNVKRILEKIVSSPITKVVFHYHPDHPDLVFNREPYRSNNVLFVKNLSNVLLPKEFKHPLTSQA